VLKDTTSRGLCVRVRPPHTILLSGAGEGPSCSCRPSRWVPRTSRLRLRCHRKYLTLCCTRFSRLSRTSPTKRPAAPLKDEGRHGTRNMGASGRCQRGMVAPAGRRLLVQGLSEESLGCRDRSPAWRGPGTSVKLSVKPILHAIAYSGLGVAKPADFWQNRRTF